MEGAILSELGPLGDFYKSYGITRNDIKNRVCLKGKGDRAMIHVIFPAMTI